jgi:hypothetical protein
VTLNIAKRDLAQARRNQINAEKRWHRADPLSGRLRTPR